MDGIHDLGGTEGWGRVPYRPETRTTVDTRWEAVAGAALFALLRSGTTNIDAHRHRIERIDPRWYLPITYWGRWLTAVESAMIDQGVTDGAEIDQWIRRAGHDPADSLPPPRLAPNHGRETTANPNSFIRTVDHQPRFGPGDRVRTLRDAPQQGHHRLPRYVRGRVGTVARAHPAFTFPDTMAHGRGEDPCHVYAVAFDAIELWGADADPEQICHVDLFEPYLKSADPENPEEPHA